MYELFVGNQPTGSGWRKTVGADGSCPPPIMAFNKINRTFVGADLSRTPPIYRPSTSHLSAQENPSVGQISSIRGMIYYACDGADKSSPTLSLRSLANN